MAWNKGTLDLLADPRQEFADKTGDILTGINLRPTVTGWQMIIKKVNIATRSKQIAFLDSWTVQELYELFYDGIAITPSTLVWKDDKF